MFFYTVRCEFQGDPQLADHWLAWLRDVHLEDVLHAGARDAQVLRIDAEIPIYEIRYSFESRADFDLYERDHAPRLRAEGLDLFPLNQGLSYQRSCGELLFSQSAINAN
ncbi:MAG TPA: DUF4286 family protein [Pirellulaceae bacterium]|nr:DUF4286 family protein [Pirellulaceae bacterium]HMO91651.1 DUF4286 family protein [Pirellulaceae bacterium]HMP68348.1 DUF4286 family protein [Pirellulaceae bacterium]